MTRGPELNIVIPEQLNLATYYLEENLAAGRGEKVAVYCRDETYSFNDMCELTNRVGNLLKELGVGFEDRVLLILQDTPEWLAGWYATMKIGGVATHAYTYLLPSDYEYFVNYVRPKVVIVDPTTLERVREGICSSIFHRAILVAGNDLPPLEKREYNLKEMLTEASSVLKAAPTTRNDLALWNFSGGTTGKSKGVPHMHHDGVVGFESFQYTIHYTPDDIVFRVPKLFFHYARDLGMNWPIRAGAAVALYPDRSTVESVFECLYKYRPTVLLNVPTMMRAMLQSPLAKDADLSFLRLCISSGELLSGQLYTEFTEKFGVEVLNSVGSAETYLGYFMDAPGEVKPGSSGKVQPDVEVKLVDQEGQEIPKGQTGILYVRSEASGTYYHLEHDKTKKTFVGNDWVNTNDLFREDEDGYFWYEGRADDLIKVSGVYVAPLEIEKCLERHRAVRECTVLGIKDADGLVKTKAFIVPNQGFMASESLAEELREHCRKNMAPFKAPRFIQFLDELPKTGQGKIDKKQLLKESR
ncbi:MAG TPA: benzoate-CoA ligase family protein [Syntrophorhabdales bacterium]|nr:benzoate-CoA ligase family protein [Syntrophorhabdales bacterium]